MLLNSSCALGQEWLKDFGHDDFRLAIHVSTLVTQTHQYCNNLYIPACWSTVGSTPSIPGPKYPKIKAHLTHSAEFVVRYPGWIRQQMQAWRVCRCSAEWGSPRLLSLLPESPGYVLVVWGMQLLVEFWRGSLSFLVDGSILAWGRFMGCRLARMAVPQEPMFPWRSARSG